MKKTVLSLFLAVILCLSLCSCGKKVSEEESTSPSEPEISTEEEAPSGVTVTKMLYAVLGTDNVKTNNFSFDGGRVSVRRIAAGLTGWTGISFFCDDETDIGNKKIVIDFRAESPFVTGEIPENVSADFGSFKDANEMRIFMLNSFCRSVRENMGDYDIYFKAAGEDIAKYNIDSNINSSTAFNKTDSSVVYVK